MESVIKKVLIGDSDDESHRYFVRFGKGEYKRRFIISFTKSKDRIKIKSSFEYANDFVKFVKKNKEAKFSGKILSKEKVPGIEGKKKAGVFVYEVQSSSIKEFENAYFYLLDANEGDIILKIKKSLPKPGKEANKIDDKFCSLEASSNYWSFLKEEFFWDVPECRKAKIEHDVKIKEIILPKDEKDPVKIREMAKRKGVIKRVIEADGKKSEEEKEFVA